MRGQLRQDSRLAGDADVFVAVRGVNADGHKFIPTLNGRGTAAVVCEELPAPDMRDDNICYVRVADSAEALGLLASRFYGDPSHKLQLVGVTGTNGKTTTATLIYEMARLEGCRAGLLSTVANYIEGEVVPATHTTPDPLELNSLLACMVEAGCSVAAMEVSSHAAHQKRIAGLKFAGGVFTNLTRDHLDYHGTFEAYRDAKKAFFDNLPESAFALTNIDDRNGMIMLQNTRARRCTYSIRSMADFTGKIVEQDLHGTLLKLNGNEVHTRFTGRYNACNLTAVYGACLLMGMDPEATLVNMSRLVPVAGRFQTFRSAEGVTAVVDYAHTPDAVVNIVSAVREVVGDGNRIITVVGAGGNRDKGKRPIMASEAARLSDQVVLTSDNPRFEEPDEIIRDMEAGLTPDDAKRTISITDRRQAIRAAVALAHPGDVIIIAGKGHEDYQEIKGIKHHFDDREEVEAALGIK
ncbi:MAG: UDP-N-acetylmuramoyl-L-alanyl-D-glutamate--2,6-diaminopimelate ligase [Muribaculaceae bacterium]|nr:UDP-N-acetylmuramoyl-L-alanyl-D-glutamate--2,6-diaminopimelate ligase [Muribaculaceae bacterium]